MLCCSRVYSCEKLYFFAACCLDKFIFSLLQILTLVLCLQVSSNLLCILALPTTLLHCQIIAVLRALLSALIDSLFCCCTSLLFCVWTAVTCEDLAQKSSVPTCCALLVKPTLLGWCSSPFVYQRTGQEIE